MNALIPERKPWECARACPINIHLSGCEGGGEGETYWPWPYRMNRAKEAGVSETYVGSSDVFMLDSAIDDPSITTEDVIEDAESYDVDYAIAADKIWDPETTTDRVIEFMDALDDSSADVETVIPLQPTAEGRSDHGEHYKKLEGIGDYYAVGGVKDASAETKRDAVESVRDVAGDDILLHGFGFGVGYFQDDRVLHRPLLDSIDCTTPIRQGRNGEYWTFEEGSLVKHKMDVPSGDFVALQGAMAAGTTLIALCRMIMHGEPEPEDLRDAGQGGLEVFAR
jgi:hypothetical protein